MIYRVSMVNKRGLYVFLAAFLAVGIFVAFLGAKDIYEKNVQSRSWPEIQAVYQDKEVYESTPYETTYWLHYAFDVGGETYTVTTDYITKNIPAPGSTIAVRYNPQNPNRVVFAEQKANLPLLIVGLLLMIFPVLIGLGFSGRLRGVFMTLGCLLAGVGFLLLSLHVPMYFAILFWLAGAGVFFKGLLPARRGRAGRH